MATSPDLLSACPLFSGFTATGLKILAQIGRERSVPAGMTVFLAGTTGESLLIVATGEVEIFSGEGEELKVLCTLGPGAHFGELALLRASTRAVSARAKGATQLVEIRRSDFNLLLKKKPQACFKLMLAVFGVVADRLQSIQADLITHV